MLVFMILFNMFIIYREIVFYFYLKIKERNVYFTRFKFIALYD